MSRGAQWALFGLSVPGGFALYLLLMVVTGRYDELVIYRLSPIWAGTSVFGLTGVACLWATSPKRWTALGRLVPSFPLPSLILILPILLIPPLRRSTRLVPTAAVNAVIWAALLSVALVARLVWQKDQIENHRAEGEVQSAFRATDVSGPGSTAAPAARRPLRRATGYTASTPRPTSPRTASRHSATRSYWRSRPSSPQPLRRPSSRARPPAAPRSRE